jgi:hypothetical protein
MTTTSAITSTAASTLSQMTRGFRFRFGAGAPYRTSGCAAAESGSRGWKEPVGCSG